MGKQSRRIYFGGADHKEIYFQGKYHDKMYMGDELVWEKLKDGPITWRTCYWSDFGPSFDLHNTGVTSFADQYDWVGYINGIPTMVSWIQQKDVMAGLLSWFSLKEGLPWGLIFSRYSYKTRYAELEDSHGSPPVFESYNTSPFMVQYYAINDVFADPSAAFMRFYDGEYPAIVNTARKWNVYYKKNDGLYKAVYGGGPEGAVEFREYEKVLLMIDGVQADIAPERFDYYSDEHGTVLQCGSIIYYTNDGTDWTTIYKGMSDFSYNRVAFLNGKYMIASCRQGMVIDSNGHEYALPYWSVGLEFMFADGGRLYFSCGDGMMYRSSDLIRYESIDIGRTVFGVSKKIFISPRKERFDYPKVPIFETAYINF